MTEKEEQSKTEAEKSATAQLRAVIADLEAIRYRLLGVRASLPVPSQEPVMLLGELDMDVSTEIRTVIECVVHDFVGSAIRDLQAAADYVPDAERMECPITSG